MKITADYRWILGILVSTVIILSYLYYLSTNQNWIIALQFLSEWMLKPYAAGSFQSLNITYEGVLLTISVFFLGLSIGVLLIYNKGKKSFESTSAQVFCISILTGYGFTGIATMILSILGQLKADLMILWLVLSICIVNAISYRVKNVSVIHLVYYAVRKRLSTQEFSKSRWSYSSSRIRDNRENKKLRILVLLGVGTLLFFVFFHALLFPIIEWDAIVYHAEVGRLWFIYKPNPPLIAGPSVGIQMSANYPSLFPAIGAFYYIVLNQFNDVYLRFVSPMLAVVLALLVYESGKEIANQKSGLVAVVLIAACPLFLMYSMWATSYMMLATYIASSLFFFIKGTKHGSKTYLFLSSLFLGFALSTSYLGILLLGFYILVVLVMIRRRQFTFRETILYSIPALAFGSIQYIRNAVLLGNPVYPEGHSLLGGLYLDNRIIEATLREISNNALGYWSPWGSSLELFLKQVHTIFFDRSLIPISSLLVIPGILFAAKKKDRQSLILGGWWFFVVAVQLLQGWFWIRTLLIVLPSAVLLTVWVIANSGIFDGNQHSESSSDKLGGHSEIRPKAKEQKIFAGALVIILCSSFVFPSLALVFVGSNTPTWPTQLYPEYEYGRAWLSIGNVNATLSNAFDGDYYAWEWLNDNLAKDERVATFDCRTYYFDDPSKIFYLDGIEAVPLYELTSLTSLLDFLRAAQVKYIWLPAWVAGGPSKHPLIDSLPLTNLLGSQYFPEIKAFPPSFNSILYEVRPQGGNLTSLCAWYGVSEEGNWTIVPADQTTTRLYISIPFLNLTTACQVTIHYLDNGNAPVYVNFWNITSNKWTIPFSTVVRNNSNIWRNHTFTFSITSNVGSRSAVFGIYPHDVDFKIDYLQVSLAKIAYARKYYQYT